MVYLSDIKLNLKRCLAFNPYYLEHKAGDKVQMIGNELLFEVVNVRPSIIDGNRYDIAPTNKDCTLYKIPAKHLKKYI